MNSLKLENLQNVGSNTISNIPHHAVMHYVQRGAVIGGSAATAFAAAPVEITAATAAAIGLSTYGFVDYSSCMAHYEGLLTQGGRPYDYRNVGLNSHVCQVDALTNVAGSLSLPIDIAGAAYRGYRNDPVMIYDTSDLTWAGRAWNNTHWMGHQFVRAVGNTFNYTSHLFSSPINYLSSGISSAAKVHIHTLLLQIWYHNI